MATLRWGFIGCGKISNDFANALKAVPGAHLRACAARSLSSAQEFATIHGFAQAYGSYEELAADPQVDAVYIGTLHTTHFEHSVLALIHGKHVLVEKPMAMNAAQAREVLALAKEKQLFFMEGMWTRFFPAVQFARKVVDDGTIGDVHHVSADIGFCFPPENERIWDRTLGGGGLLDIGIYPLAFVTMVLGGQPEKVSAAGKLTDGGVDLYGTITLEYSGGRFGAVSYTCAAQMGESVTIVGSKGRVLVHSPAHVPSRVSVFTNADAQERVSVFPWPEPAANATPSNFGPTEGFQYEALAVTASILNKETENSEYPHAESLAITEIMDKVRAAIGVVYPADVAN
ncbi:hypothetical protein PybrP1_010456 [[Pythium] brassicae (nom. inval.)]|nr:hypothetical protein PybrP1_010456 [[Pythium] brassicae (nom. inval.)]